MLPTKLLLLSNNMGHALVDADDYDRLTQYTWSRHPKWNRIYRTVSKGHKSFSPSLAATIMQQPFAMFDHIDRDPFNNKKSNLRPCTHQQNNRNRTKSLGTSSAHKGVTRNKVNCNWRAGIKVNKKLIYLGSFDSELDAARAYDAAAIKYFGEFANLNFN